MRSIRIAGVLLTAMCLGAGTLAAAELVVEREVQRPMDAFNPIGTHGFGEQGTISWGG